MAVRLTPWAKPGYPGRAHAGGSTGGGAAGGRIAAAGTSAPTPRTWHPSAARWSVATRARTSTSPRTSPSPGRHRSGSRDGSRSLRGQHRAPAREPVLALDPAPQQEPLRADALQGEALAELSPLGLRALPGADPPEDDARPPVREPRVLQPLAPGGGLGAGEPETGQPRRGPAPSRPGPGSLRGWHQAPHGDAGLEGAAPRDRRPKPAP